jgi:hypothetical protein
MSDFEWNADLWEGGGQSNTLVQNCPTGMATLRIWQGSSAHLHRGLPFATIAYLFNRTSGDEMRLNAESLLLENKNFYNKYPQQ